MLNGRGNNVWVLLGSMVFGTIHNTHRQQNGNPLHDNVCIILCHELRWPYLSHSVCVSLCHHLARSCGVWFVFLLLDWNWMFRFVERVYIGSANQRMCCMRWSVYYTSTGLGQWLLFNPNDRVINDLCMCSAFTCTICIFVILLFFFVHYFNTIYA